jgi:hypothetical protein
MLAIYHFWSGLAINVGHQAASQEIFFGTEYRNVTKFIVPNGEDNKSELSGRSFYPRTRWRFHWMGT